MRCINRAIFFLIEPEHSKFCENVKPASIEDKTNEEAKVSQSNVVILPFISDDDSLFKLRSLTPKKKKKAGNSKQIDNVLML